MSNEYGLNLDAKREQRAAEREGKNEPLPITIGGDVVAVLPVELPIDVFAPLTDIDEALVLLLREAMTMATGNDAEKKWEATNLVIGLLATTDNLPRTTVEVIRKIAENLMGVEGLAEFLKARPSKDDVAELAKGVLAFYGVSLGESSPSSDSPENGGGTSNTTAKSNSTDSTPDASTDTPEIPTS